MDGGNATKQNKEEGMFTLHLCRHLTFHLCGRLTENS
jgi:hypothetical protein